MIQEEKIPVQLRSKTKHLIQSVVSCVPYRYSIRAAAVPAVEPPPERRSGVIQKKRAASIGEMKLAGFRWPQLRCGGSTPVSLTIPRLARCALATQVQAHTHTHTQPHTVTHTHDATINDCDHGERSCAARDHGFRIVHQGSYTVEPPEAAPTQK